jgi:hypothetical protein
MKNMNYDSFEFRASPTLPAVRRSHCWLCVTPTAGCVSHPLLAVRYSHCRLCVTPTAAVRRSIGWRLGSNKNRTVN